MKFVRGAKHPLYSDTIHFGSTPKEFLSTCWVALEDTDYNNGALQIVESRHKNKDIDFYELNIFPPKKGSI